SRRSHTTPSRAMKIAVRPVMAARLSRKHMRFAPSSSARDMACLLELSRILRAGMRGSSFISI
ncbi:MAG: hypothetical protein ACRDHE_08040, partial [Ktedonobacterales bacterium]